jgi:hypothetical protein
LIHSYSTSYSSFFSLILITPSSLSDEEYEDEDNDDEKKKKKTNPTSISTPPLPSDPSLGLFAWRLLMNISGIGALQAAKVNC